MAVLILKPRTYLYMWGGVWIVLLRLVPPPSLRLGCGGVPYRLLRPCQAACFWGWGERVFWRSHPPWEGYHLRLKISCCNSPSEVLGFWPSYPLPPLQLLEESLIELLLD